LANKVTIGTTFPSMYADSIPLWKVVRDRGGNAYDCVVVSEDWTGTKKVFGGEEILAAKRSQEFYQEMADDHDTFWNNQTVGATVHYHNGFGSFVRGVIVVEDGEKKMRPTALVGKWAAYDLPRIDAAGNFQESYHARQIREGTLMQPNYSNMVEAVGVRDGETDPRGQPEIDLAVPNPTPEQVEAHRLSQIREQVLAFLDTDRDHEKAQSEVLRDGLANARTFLNAMLLEKPE
jgi:hypothetical protein